MLSFVGFGTYFGLSFVLRRSNPTIDVPRGTITPPWILFNLYRALSGVVRSKLVNRSYGKRSGEVVPFLSLKLFDN